MFKWKAARLWETNISKLFFYFKLAKYESSLYHTIAFSSEKFIPSESGEKYAQIKFTSQNSSKQLWVDFDVRGQQGMDCFTGESVIMDYGNQKQ